jgi:hypothetical protein
MPVVSFQRGWVGRRSSKFYDSDALSRRLRWFQFFLLGKGFAAGSDQRREFGPRMRRLKLGGQTTQKAIPTLRRNELNPDRQTVRCGV